MNAGDSKTLNNIKSHRLLTLDEEASLSSVILNNPGTREAAMAIETLVVSNMRMVEAIARQFTSHKEDLEDLTSEGALALQKAAERFDSSKGKFSTYARWWIKQHITSYLSKHSRTIRIPVHQLDKFSKIQKISRSLAAELGRDPTVEEIADATGSSEKSIQKILDSVPTTTSLQTPLGEDGGELMDLISDPKSESPLADLQLSSEFELLQELLETLSPKERDIISERYGLGGTTPKSLEVVGENIGVSRERIRQIQNQGLKKLQRGLKKLLAAPKDRLDIPREPIEPSTFSAQGLPDFVVLDPRSGEPCARVIDLTKHLNCRAMRLINAHRSGRIRKYGDLLYFNDSVEVALSKHPSRLPVKVSCFAVSKFSVPNGLTNAVIDPSTLRVCARLCDLAKWTKRRSTNGAPKLAKKYPIRTCGDGPFLDVLDVQDAYQKNLSDNKKALIKRNLHLCRPTKLSNTLKPINPSSMLHVAMEAWESIGYIHLPHAYADLKALLPYTEHGTPIHSIRALEERVSKLPTNKRVALAYRFGILGHDPHTLIEITEKLGGTPSYISQLQKSAVRQLLSDIS